MRGPRRKVPGWLPRFGRDDTEGNAVEFRLNRRWAIPKDFLVTLNDRPAFLLWDSRQ